MVRKEISLVKLILWVILLLTLITIIVTILTGENGLINQWKEENQSKGNEYHLKAQDENEVN